jgi:hypothetical protein
MKRKSIIEFAFLVIAFLLVYVIGYILLMFRNKPVIEAGKIRFYSTCILAKPKPREIGGFDTGAREASIFNYIFLPADWIYYKFDNDSFLVKGKSDPRFRHMYPD